MRTFGLWERLLGAEMWNIVVLVAVYKYFGFLLLNIW